MSFQDTIKNTLLRDNRKANPMMRRRAQIACLVLIAVILLAAYGGNLSAYIGNLSVKDYYGEHYSELLHLPSTGDKQFALPAAQLFEEAIAFEGTDAEAQEKYGILARYCGYSDWELKLVTASAADGALWFTYSNNTSKNVLVRFAIADGVVTDILEHP